MCEIWSSASDNLLSQIYKKQKTAIRVINNSKYNDHTKPLFKNSGILPLEQLIKYSKLHFIHGIIYNRAPISFNETLLTNAQYRQYNNFYDRELRNDGDLFIPFARTSQILRFPLISFPTLWNSLPPDLSMIRNINEFKSKLKLFYLNQLPETVICQRLFCSACNRQQIQVDE